MEKDAPYAFRQRKGLKGALFDSPKTKQSQKPAVPLTAAERQRAYRQRLKENPEKYRKHKEYNNLRLRVYRDTLKGQALINNREKTRIRVAKHRALKKAQGIISKKEPPKTRAAQEKKKEYWRNKKREERERRTPREQKEINKRRREKRRHKAADEAAKKARREEKKENKLRHNVAPEDVYSSRNALRKAVNRVRTKMPASSEKVSEIIKHLVFSASPSTKRRLSNGGITSSNTKESFLEDTSVKIKTLMKSLHKKRNTVDLQKKRIITAAISLKKKYIRQQMKHLGLGYKMIRKSSLDTKQQRKKRCDALDDQTVKQVTEFYNRGDISRDLPDARSATKVDGHVVGRKVLECTVSSAYAQFNEENGAKKLAFSTFQKLRPKNVLTMNNNKRASCLCEYCVNINFKLNALNTNASLHGMSQCAIKGKYEASKNTLCPQDGKNPKKECLDRECELCGPHLLDVVLKPLMDSQENSQISWMRWGMETVSYGGNEVRRMAKTKQTGTVRDLVTELKEELQPFSKHLFNGQWQWQRYNDVTKNVPKNWVVFCMDYAENYVCHAQDEAQGAHWSNVQCTIHPVVATYQCPEESCSSTVTNTLMFVSDDIKHDYHGVQHFSDEAIKIIKEDGVTIENLVHFTDGAASQYKCKVNFADASFSLEDHGFPMEKHYFGSRHGKGPCDREIGVLKKQVNLDINARRVEVANASDLHMYGKQRLTRPKISTDHVHTKRSFHFVKIGKINRSRPERTIVKVLVGTTKLHCVQGVQPYELRYKERSCFCQVCVGGRGVCKEADLTGTWKKAYIGKSNKTATNATAGLQDGGEAVEHVPPGAASSDVPPRAASSDVPPRAASSDVPPRAASSVATPSGTGSTVKSFKVGEGDFVAIAVEGRQRKVAYIAKVLEFDSDREEVKVSYLEKVSASAFSLPSEADSVYWHPLTDVRASMGIPSVMGTGSRLKLIFNNLSSLHALISD